MYLYSRYITQVTTTLRRNTDLIDSFCRCKGVCLQRRICEPTSYMSHIGSNLDPVWRRNRFESKPNKNTRLLLSRCHLSHVYKAELSFFFSFFPLILGLQSKDFNNLSLVFSVFMFFFLSLSMASCSNLFFMGVSVRMLVFKGFLPPFPLFSVLLLLAGDEFPLG